MNKKFYVYVLLTEKNTLYCGYTDDVDKRYEKHKNGTGCKYTRAFKPIDIVYKKEFDSKSEAMKEEKRIKTLTREQKLEFIGLNL